jgi:sec-independent protein translocase protein TatB
MLNIGPPELILIFVIALVVVGPQRLPELGRTIGRWMGELRKMQDEVKDMVNTGMGDEFQQTAAELRRTATDLKSATDVSSAFRDDAPRTWAHGPVMADAPNDGATAAAGAEADVPEPDERSGETGAGLEAPEAPDGPAE